MAVGTREGLLVGSILGSSVGLRVGSRNVTFGVDRVHETYLERTIITELGDGFCVGDEEGSIIEGSIVG